MGQRERITIKQLLRRTLVRQQQYATKYMPPAAKGLPPSGLRVNSRILYVISQKQRSGLFRVAYTG